MKTERMTELNAELIAAETDVADYHRMKDNILDSLITELVKHEPKEGDSPPYPVVKIDRTAIDAMSKEFLGVATGLGFQEDAAEFLNRLS